MKKSLLLFGLLLFIALGLTSCSDNDYRTQENSKSVKSRIYSSQVEEAKALALPVDEVNRMPKKIKDKRAAAVILSNYVSIKDSLYSLDISKDDAKKIGIDEDLYMAILQDLISSNKAIINARKNGEKIILPDIKKEFEKYKKSNKTSQLENFPTTRATKQSGSISTTGTEEGKASFQPTYDKTAVTFTCRTNAAITPVYTCKTYAFGVWKVRTKVGTLFTNSVVNVELAASGSSIWASVCFATTDSNGGSCNWKAVN